MDPEFTQPEYGSFKLGYSLPQAYRGYLLQGAEVITATGHAGNIVIQTFEQPLFTIRFKLLEFFQPVKIPFRQKAAQLVSHLAIKNNIHYSINGLGALKLEQGQFSLFHCREEEYTARFDKGTIYQSLEIDWSEEILSQAAPYFDLLQSLYTSNKPGKNFYLANPAYTAGHKVLDLAHEILKSHYNACISGLLFHHKVQEYLLLMLVDAGKKTASGLHLSSEEWEKIDEIAKAVMNEPGKKFPIAGLAARAQMNPMKLKMAFKEKHNQGIFEYQMASRMKEAHRLLEETTLSTKAIASLVGYEKVTSFITKFREYFGYPPGKVNRKY